MGGLGTTEIILLGVLGLVAYFIGNISPSTIMAKRQGLDIKKEGSGNAGTTNALRVMGKKAGAITCIVDILKGVVAVLIGLLVGGPLAAYLCALCVFLGHVWPIVYKFQGGKGVATAFGAVLAVNPLLALISLVIVAIVVFTSKRMSLGSIVGAVAFAVLAAFMEPGFFVFACVMAIIMIIKHRTNIVRLIHGEEPIMGIFKKKDQTEADEGGQEDE
ncbi:MAG: glycerol-3-phosphate 1-O-acyltransferase PlsY [Clostridia bacterium]|nr:glycerol-3-phosphate 1-O-acyltransferase PlsY [Clostridia bacterium]